MKNPEAYADVVVLTIKSALAPVLERLAVSEQSNRDLQAQVAALTELRDRITKIETRAEFDTLLAKAHEPAPSVDLNPVLERVAAAEARLSVLGDLRDRVVTVETKAAATPATEPAGYDAAPLLERIAALSERLAVAEVRQLVPGPAGKDGADGLHGKDGSHGVNGADGLGFDDVVVEHDGERTFTVKYARGERVKTAGTFTVPMEIYRGVYELGKSYDRGDCTTWGGSEWHCNEPTTAKPGESKAWTLKVKRGRDGRDGKDAETLPVVSLGAR